MQMDWRTIRKDSASSVSKSLGRARALPTKPVLVRLRFRCAGGGRVETPGDGDDIIRSSDGGSSSSAFRFRPGELPLV